MAAQVRRALAEVCTVVRLVLNELNSFEKWLVYAPLWSLMADGKLTKMFWLLNFYGRPMEYFHPVVFSSFFFFFYLFSSPNLSGHTLDVYHTSTHGVALVRI